MSLAGSVLTLRALRDTLNTHTLGSMTAMTAEDLTVIHMLKDRKAVDGRTVRKYFAADKRDARGMATLAELRRQGASMIELVLAYEEWS